MPTDGQLPAPEGAAAPFFSICIPQYGRFDHLLAQIERLGEQSSTDWEICISDDLSPEARHREVITRLESMGARFRYLVQERNLRYDGNMRAAIDLASGRYCLLMGNDDRLAGRDTLQTLKNHLTAAGFPEIAITNYRDAATGAQFRRVRRDGDEGRGADTALRTFRHYAFVSGLLFERSAALRHRADRWDGSEMYQMALATAIVAAGGRTLGLCLVAVEKDVELDGATRDLRAAPSAKAAKKATRLPLSRIPEVVWDAARPFVSDDKRVRSQVVILAQVQLILYPFWLMQRREVRGWGAARELAAQMRPALLTSTFAPGPFLKTFSGVAFGLATAAGFATPIAVYRRLAPTLYRFAKSLAWSKFGRIDQGRR